MSDWPVKKKIDSLNFRLRVFYFAGTGCRKKTISGVRSFWTRHWTA
jgi:hypothetical protein